MYCDGGNVVASFCLFLPLPGPTFFSQFHNIGNDNTELCFLPFAFLMHAHFDTAELFADDAKISLKSFTSGDLVLFLRSANKTCMMALTVSQPLHYFLPCLWIFNLSRNYVYRQLLNSHINASNQAICLYSSPLFPGLK